MTPTGRRGKDRKGDTEEGLGRGARGVKKKKKAEGWKNKRQKGDQ